MRMKTLLSAAHAAGYALAPSEEQFHAVDGGSLRVVGAREIDCRSIAQRASVPALPAPAAPAMAETWLKGLFSGVMTRRATA